MLACYVARSFTPENYSLILFLDTRTYINMNRTRRVFEVHDVLCFLCPPRRHMVQITATVVDTYILHVFYCTSNNTQ